MKNLLFAFFFAFISSATFAQDKTATYQLSSHILDVSKGMPASGVTIKLEKFNDAKKNMDFGRRKSNRQKWSRSRFFAE